MASGVPVTDCTELTTEDVSIMERETEIKTEDVCVAPELPMADNVKMEMTPEKLIRAPAALPQENGEEIQALIKREGKSTGEKKDQIHVLKDALKQPKPE